MSVSLRWSVARGADSTEVSLSGPIDELSNFDALFDAIASGQLVKIDLSQVHRISSVGVRVWIIFMDKLRASETPVQLVGCSVCIVRQMSMISQFRGHGTIASVYAPYYCVRCNKEQLRLIEMSGDIKTQLRKPVICPTCGAELALDEEEALYTDLL
jgi:anti-anti-sigma regulatory factor